MAFCLLAGAGRAGTSGTQDGGTQDAAKESLTVDAALLRERGLPPSLAGYLSEQRRFPAGWQPVQLVVNGEPLGSRNALFDPSGRLCFLPEFIAQAGLLPQPDVPPQGADAADRACPAAGRVMARIVVSLQPAAGVVDITVPEDARRTPEQRVRSLSGGVGGLFNYRAYTLDFASAGTSSVYRNRYADTTLGVNAGGWMFRSHQDYDASTSGARLRWRGAYAQKTLDTRREVVQAGLLGLQDPLFGGLPLVGAQWFPEHVLAGGSGYPVRGVAPSRARVKLTQHGILLLDTSVPPGPFVLSNYVLIDRNSDLQVEVLDDGGGTQAFVVPSAALLLAADDARFGGWTLAAGVLRDPSGVPMAAGSRGWTLGPLATTAGFLTSAAYASAGAAMNARFESLRSNVGAQVLSSRAAGHSGVLANATTGRTFGEAWRVGVSASLRSPGYRSVQDTALDNAAQRSQVGLALAWNAPAAGALALGLTHERLASTGSADTLNLAWNKTLPGAVTLSVGLIRRDARPGPVVGAEGTPGSSHSFYASLTWPLGDHLTSRTNLQGSAGAERLSTAIEDQVHPQWGYRATVEGGSGPPGRDLTLYGTPYFTTLSGGVTQNGSSQTLHVDASGGVVRTRDGVAFSPYPVEDSFGTVRTGELALARIETPQGPVWSGPNALAALPHLPPYLDSRIELAGGSVPLDVEVGEGVQVVQASRGAVLLLNMGLQRVHRWMLTIRMADGRPLPAGAAILRNGTDLEAVSDDAGQALVVRKSADDTWWAELADGQRCALGAFETLPSRADDFFERSSARCR